MFSYQPESSFGSDPFAWFEIIASQEDTELDKLVRDQLLDAELRS